TTKRPVRATHDLYLTNQLFELPSPVVTKRGRHVGSRGVFGHSTGRRAVGKSSGRAAGSAARAGTVRFRGPSPPRRCVRRAAPSGRPGTAACGDAVGSDAFARSPRTKGHRLA